MKHLWKMSKLFFLCAFVLLNAQWLAKKDDQEYLLKTFQLGLPEHVKYKVDVSFLIADVKYDGNSLKILEFGNLVHSNISSHELLYGDDRLWKSFLNQLHGYDLPVWFVGRDITSDRAKAICYRKMIEFGGRYFKSLKLLIEDEEFRRCFGKKNNVGDDIEKCKGIIVFTGYTKELNTIKEIFPGFIVLNMASTPYSFNKYKMCTLFCDEDTKRYKPQWGIYETVYSQALSKKIMHDLNCDLFVIKPIAASRGYGVIIVDKNNLDKTLQLIFENKGALKGIGDMTYKYWLMDKNKHFLVESFQHSKPISFKNRIYDGTMRVIFSLSSFDGKTTLTFLGCYWKLPDKSLEESGTLVEKHKSKVNEDHLVNPAKVSDKDAKHVQEMLCSVLPKVYIKMLESL